MALTEADLSAEPYSQAHLFEGADLTEDDKKSRVTQLNDINGRLPGGGLKGYLERSRSLLKDAQAGANPFSGLRPEVPAGQKLTGETGPGSEVFAEFERLGMAELSKCVFCLVAGGLGERLGYPGIKIGIVAEVTLGKTFIEMYCEFILAFQSYARGASADPKLTLPLAIMTSGDTHDQTVEIMKSNNFFGLSQEQVHFLKQEKVPALIDIEGRIAAKGCDVETKPHGHGDVHSLIHQYGLSSKWVAEGRQWLFIFQDTNPLPLRILCALLGVSSKSNYVMNSVAIPRIPGESIGGICRLVDGSKDTSLTINVEYNQLDPLLKETETGGDFADESGFSPFPGNINVLLFKLDDYDRCLQGTGGVVPEFVNPKWADKERTKFKSPTRLECMMQDFPRLCSPTDLVGMTQLDRWICKTSVKNNLADAAKKNPPECALSAEADLYACNARLLQLAAPTAEIEPSEDVAFLGITAQLGARILLKPSFAVSLEEMKSKLLGKICISKSSTLILDGNVVIDGLTLNGALTVTGSGGAKKDLCVENQGCTIEAIPPENLSSQQPSFQIRGYALRPGAMEHIDVAGSLL